MAAAGPAPSTTRDTNLASGTPGVPLNALAFAGISLGLLVVISGVGGPHDALTGASVVAWRLLTAGTLAAATLVAAYGFGRLLDPLARETSDPAAVRWGLGLALLFTLIHLLGWLGMLTPIASGLITTSGLTLAIVPWAKRLTSRPRLMPSGHAIEWMLPALPAIVVLTVASANPPGWLWSSEFGGYDALSYHLPLAREWIALGAIRPLEHNVYSYLPSYAEAGFMHIAQLVRAPGAVGLGQPVTPDQVFLVHSGLATYASQFMHAGLGLIAARAMLGVLRGVVGSGVDSSDKQPAGWIAAGLLLATPWVVVVGSLAYNELGVVALGVCALAAVLVPANADSSSPAWRRGVIAGVLTGAACGFKPTALLFVAPAVGVALLACLPVRTWAVATFAACVAGLAMLAPWLIRNALHGGNPVFPQLTGVFGTAHWNAEQAARYASAHVFDGSIIDRLRLLLWTDPAANHSAPTIERFRGFANPQWAGLGAIALLGGAFAWFRSDARRAVVVLLIGLALQIAAWLTFTHLQSRFLLPAVVWLAALVGIGCHALGQRRWNTIAGWVVVLALSIVTCGTFITQARARDAQAFIGAPNAWLLPGTTAFGGPESWIRDGFDARYTPADVGTIAPGDLTWTAALNGVLPAGSMVLLVGDATPFYIAGPVVYATTYDRSPLAHAMLDAPDDPDRWTDALRAQGITHVVIAPSELSRLESSGWLDPVFTAPMHDRDTDAPNRLQAWLSTLGAPALVWNTQQGRALFELKARGTE